MPVRYMGNFLQKFPGDSRDEINLSFKAIYKSIVLVEKGEI